uniref:Galactokinase n=2 Tax=Opuntia streptacantha TaxID=393608 RepID=A0A7C9F4F2_OPUST
MGACSWPSEAELKELRDMVAEMSGRTPQEVRVVVSPYRICPLGAHVDHQVVLRSAQFEGELRFRVDETQHPKNYGKENGTVNSNGSVKPEQECGWGRYARGALYALQSKGNVLNQGIIGLISGSMGLDSSGLSSSAAVGIAYLLALENANDMSVSPTENIEYDRLIENEYLGLSNGILDQSAILLSRRGCLTFMDCKTKEHKLIRPQNLQVGYINGVHKSYKILLASSGLKQALTSNSGYNRRVAECREAARVLLNASGRPDVDPILSNVEPHVYEVHKDKLEPVLARRAEHYFSETMRVMKGLEAWTSGRLDEFGRLITASGRSSIENYECGCKPLIDLYEALLRAPGVYGARFSGAGFRGCCLAFVDAEHASEAASFVKTEYSKLQPELASKIAPEAAVLICESGEGARVIGD